MKTPILRIRRKTPLVMRESEGNLTVHSIHLVECKDGARGHWYTAGRFNTSEEREEWIGKRIAEGARMEGKYPLEPITAGQP